MTHTPKQARLWRVLLVGGMIALALVGYVVVFDITGLGMPCVLHELTGLQCGGCGLTRAAVSLLHLDFAAAFSYHALWPLFVGYILWVGISAGVVYILRGEVQLLPGKWWMHTAVLAVMVAYGSLRNFI